MIYLAHSREQRLIEEKNNNHMDGTAGASPAAGRTEGGSDLAYESTFTERVIDSFNLRKNLNTIFRTDSGPQSLPVICGMK